MKFFLSLCSVLCFVTNTQSQQLFATQNYDSSWAKTDSDSSYYYCTFKIYDNMFLKECYWRSTQSKRSIAMMDGITFRSKTIGKALTYYADSKIETEKNYDEDGRLVSSYSYHTNGILTDSVFYNGKDEADSAFHYYEDRSTRAIYYAGVGKKAFSLMAYNRNGGKIENVNYLQKTRFGKRDTDWRNFLTRTLDLNAAMKGAYEGEFTVMVQFTVEKDGTITNIIPLTNNGWGMEREVVKMMKKSPKWQPEIFLGEAISVVRTQPVTFLVPEGY